MRQFAVGLLLVSLATAASAQALVWRFDKDGDLEGWKPTNYASLEVKDGAMRGVTKFDPMLTSPPLNLDASQYPILEFRATSDVTDGGEIFFHGPDDGFSDARMSRHMLLAGPDPQVYRVNLADVPAWRGIITGIRLDLLNDAGAQVEVDYVRFLTRAPGAVPNESFEDDTQFPGNPDYWRAAGGWMKVSDRGVTEGTRSAELKIPAGVKGHCNLVTRAPLDMLGVFSLQADVELSDANADAQVKLVFYDVFGRQLPQDSWVRLRSDRGQTKRHLERTFLAPTRAASADVSLEVTGPGVTCWWDNIRLTHVREDPDLNSAPVESWHASWIWAAATSGLDNCTAVLRKSFELPVALDQIKDARVQVSADDKYKLYVNGRLAAENDETNGWRNPKLVDLKPFLVAGRNVLAVQAWDVASAEGFLLEGWIRAPGHDLELLSDATWKAAGEAPVGWEQAAFDDASWPAAKVLTLAGGEPWGHLPYAYLGPREQLRPTKIECPKQIVAGQAFRAMVVLDRVPQAASKFAPRFALRKDGETFLARPIEPEKNDDVRPTRLGPVELTLSPFMPAGRYEVVMGYPYTGYGGRDDVVIGTVTVSTPARPEAPVRAEIKRHNGVPTLFLNGQPNSFMHYLELTVGATRIGNFADNAKLHLYEVDAVDLGWKGDGKFDYTEWDRKILELLTYDPQAVIIPTYDVSGLREPWWIEAHPDQACLDANGSAQVGIYGSTGKIISLASQVWRKEYADAVTRFTRHCLAAPWSGRIIGYQPCSGVSWEWQHWASVGPFTPTDYSAPMQEAFRTWTRKRFGNDVAKLRAAWNQPDLTFETVRIPSVEQRDSGDHFVFRDPVKSAYVIDFYRFWQDVMVDGIEHVFGTVKQVHPQALVGTYYGYTVTMLSGARRAGDAGHYALMRLLNSPRCDFLMSPLDYAARNVGESFTLMSPIGSVLAHDKVWILQADLRTHLMNEPSAQEPPASTTLAGTLSTLERAVAHGIAKDSATQWYDFSYGWIARDARQGQVINKLRKIGQEWASWPNRGPDPDGVAVIVDEDTPSAYMSHHYEANLWAVYQQKMTFERLGAPWNVYLLDDVVSGKLPKFRAYFFLNCYRMSEPERQWIVKNLQGDGRVLVWTYAPGYVTEQALSVGAISELTGMQFTERAEERDWRMTFDEKSALTQGLGPVPQPNMKLGPVFVPQAQPEEVSAVWEGTDIPALVVRKQAGDSPSRRWTSVYTAGPLLSPELLKRLARLGGVPIIVPGSQPSYVCRNMVGLHSAVKRLEPLVFPRPVTVTDMMTGEVLGRKVKQLDVPMQGPQTRLLRVQ